MIQILLSVAVYVVQIGITLIVAGILPYILYKKRKQAFLSLVMLLFFLFVEIASIHALSKHPFWTCPEEYQTHISSEDKERIIGFNSGFYSQYIPVFPVLVSVQYADEDLTVVHTYYAFFGRTEMHITDDGPSLESNLLGQNN